MKVLLTGARGFIGRNVLRRLKDMVDVVAFSSSSINGVKTILHNNYYFANDFFLTADMSDITVLIHIGAFTPKDSSLANDKHGYLENIRTTQALLSVDLPNLKRIIFISSLDVYKCSNERIDETSAVEPSSLYGESKLICEQLIRKYCDDQKIIFQILRLGHVFGPGEDHYKKLIPMLIKQCLMEDKMTIFGDPAARRSFIYIDDVVTAIIGAINLPQENDLINVVGGDAITIDEIAMLIKEISCKNVQIFYTHPEYPSKSVVFNNGKMVRLLFNSPLIDYKTGLTNEYNYFKEILHIC